MAPTSSTVSPTLQPPDSHYLEKQAHMTQARLELLWDDWHSQVEKPSRSCLDSPSNNPSLISLEEHSSNQPLPPKSSTQVGTSKRWGLLKTKLRLTETSLHVDKDTDVRQKQDKLLLVQQKAGTGRNLMKLKKKAQEKILDGMRAPSMKASHSPVLPITPTTPQTAVTQYKLAGEYFESNDSAIYFTVDPNWDSSKGDAADVYLLTDVPTYTCPGETSQHQAASVVAVSEPIRNTNQKHSFLTLE